MIDRPGFTLGTDLYYIQYQNYIDSRTVGDITTFYNQGGAVYKGVELQEPDDQPVRRNRLPRRKPKASATEPAAE